MRKADCSMWICLKRNSITLNNPTIVALGKPLRLNIWYENDSRLIFTPASNDELDSYEIPPYFWKHPNPALVISQLSFFMLCYTDCALKKTADISFPAVK